AHAAKVILKHGESLDAEAECKPADFIAVVANVFQNLGVHHPGATDFNPASAFADPAGFAGAAAHEALHIDFCTGLCEREEARAETGAETRTKHGPQELLQRSLQVSQ